VAWALGVGDGAAPVRVVRCVWASGSEPVAISTAYVPDAVATMASDDEMLTFADALQALPGGTAAPRSVYAAAVDMELSPPQPSVARSLRLVPGQSAISVTIRFDDTATRAPVGLSVVILKPDRFRVVIEAS
jgi:DNA-binding GntR family transcriptional regulator